MRGVCRSGIRGSGKISLWYAMRVNRDKEKLLVTCVCSNIEREAAVRTETIGWIIGILIAAALVWWIYRKIKRKIRQLASMPEVQVFEPIEALDGKEDGLYFYRKIVEQSKDYLNSGGSLMFEIGYDQGKDVSKMMTDAGFSNVCVKKDLAGNDRVVTGML